MENNIKILIEKQTAAAWNVFDKHSVLFWDKETVDDRIAIYRKLLCDALGFLTPDKLIIINTRDFDVTSWFMSHFRIPTCVISKGKTIICNNAFYAVHSGYYLTAKFCIIIINDNFVSNKDYFVEQGKRTGFIQNNFLDVDLLSFKNKFINDCKLFLEYQLDSFRKMCVFNDVLIRRIQQEEGGDWTNPACIWDFSFDELFQYYMLTIDYHHNLWQTFKKSPFAIIESPDLRDIQEKDETIFYNYDVMAIKYYKI